MPAPSYTPLYNVHYGATSGTFNAGEALHWSGAGGPSTGTLASDSTGSKDMTFYHLTGPGPQVGDVIDGDVTHAQRTITSFNNTVANPGLSPTYLPTFGTTDVVGVELDIDLVTTSSVSNFATVFTFFGSLIGGVAGWSLHTPNNIPSVMPNDFSGYWDGVGSHPVVAGTGFGLSAQFSPTAQAGCEQHISYTASPRFTRYFANVDGLGVSWPTFTARDSIASFGTIRMKASMCQTVTDPEGNFTTVFPANTWQALTGDFAVWKIDIALGAAAPWQRLGVFFIDPDYQGAIDGSDPIGIVPECFTNYPSTANLTANPIDFRYIVRLYSRSTKRWHEFPNWKLSGSQTLSPDPAYGWSPSSDPTKVCYVSGVAGEQVTGRYVFTRLSYHRGDTLAALPFDSIEDITVGGQTFNGSAWHDGTGFPAVAHEADRGFLWLKPDTAVAAVAIYTAPETASYTLTGDFARASDNMGSGDGVTVSITANGTTLHSDTISAAHVVDPTSYTTLFAGTGKSTYNVSAALTAGDLVKFTVASGGASRTDDETALRITGLHYLRAGRARTPVTKGDPFYVRPGYLFQNASFSNGIVKPAFTLAPVALAGLRHQVFFFDDADDDELWTNLPDGTIAVALSQSESDTGQDIRAFLNTIGQSQFKTGAGNRKVWLHTFSRSDVRASSTGSNTPPLMVAGTVGYVPRGTSMYTNDLTLSGNNLLNGRIINFHGYRHTVLGFRDILDGDTYVARRGVVATAFQATAGISSYCSTRIAARGDRSTTIQFDTDGTDPDIEGWLHLWSR